MCCNFENTLLSDPCSFTAHNQHNKLQLLSCFQLLNQNDEEGKSPPHHFLYFPIFLPTVYTSTSEIFTGRPSFSDLFAAAAINTG